MADSDERHLKIVYRTTLVVAIVGFHIVMLVVFGLVERWVIGGRWNQGGAGGAMSLPILVAAHFVARARCRWLGISRDSHGVLVITRGTATPNPDTPLEADLHYPPKLWATLAVMCMFCVIAIVVVLACGPVVPGQERYAYLLIAGFSAATVFCAWLAMTGGGFAGRADEQGVSGHHGNRVLVRYVEWEQIESCEVAEVRNALGELFRPWFVFKDRDGFVLLKMLTPVEAEQTERFKAVIERYLATPGEPRA